MIVSSLILILALLGTQGWGSPEEYVDQPSLRAWSDPTDNREAIYVHAPDGACAVSLNETTGIITINLCEEP